MMTGAYTVLQYFASCVFNAMNSVNIFSVKEVLYAAFPRNYYLYLFCALYAFAPFLNHALLKLSKKSYFRLCVILLSLFSLWSTFINTLDAITEDMEEVGCFFTSRTGTSMGFNIANFTMIYIIGGYLQLFYSPNKKRDIFLSIAILLISTCITTIGKVLFPTISKAFLYYDSIFIVLSAVALVILFLNIQIKSNKVITFMGVHTFGTFLIHGFSNNCVEKLVTIESVVTKGFLGTIIGILVYVIGVYILALLMTAILELIPSPINKKWKTTKIYNYQFWIDEAKS